MRFDRSGKLVHPKNAFRLEFLKVFKVLPGEKAMKEFIQWEEKK